MVFQEAIRNSIFHEISNYCSANNIESFVVGGFVRDFLLEHSNKNERMRIFIRTKMIIQEFLFERSNKN